MKTDRNDDNNNTNNTSASTPNINISNSNTIHHGDTHDNSMYFSI